MRYNIPKKREIAEDHEQDVYFWDGQVCVRSGVITIGNPPSNTISIQNLTGVSLGRDSISLMNKVVYCIVAGLAFAFAGWSATDNWEYNRVFVVSLSTLTSLFLFWVFKPRPYVVTLKVGSALGDESFYTKNREWAERLSQAVSQAIAIEQHRRGGGGQAVPQAPIFPDPTFTRN